MTFYFSRFVVIAFLFLLACMAGCASTQTSRFYALSAMAGSFTHTPSGSHGGNVSLGVGPVKMADYLDRNEVVTRRNRTEIEMSEFDRWAGQLKDSFSGVLSENLSILLGTDRVVLYPWRGSIPLDYRIEIEVIQFDGEPGAGATLVAQWLILEGDSGDVLTMKRSHISENVSEPGYSAMVAAQSRLLLSFSREIASQIGDLHSKKSEE